MKYFSDCGDPPEIEGAYSKYLNKSIVEYKCHSTKYDNYKLNGNPEIKCLANGSWTTHNFTCKNILTGLNPWYNLPTENKTIETGTYNLIDRSNETSKGL